MVPVLNPSNELKEIALARIPKACRNTFYRVNPDGSSEKVESVFDLKKDDKFFIATSKGLVVPTVMQFGSFFMGDSKDFIRIVNPKIGEVLHI